jgi:hypothetical protein
VQRLWLDTQKKHLAKSPAVAFRNNYKRGGVKGSIPTGITPSFELDIEVAQSPVHTGPCRHRLRCSYRCRDICAKDMQVQVQITGICYCGPKAAHCRLFLLQQLLILKKISTIIWTLPSHGRFSSFSLCCDVCTVWVRICCFLRLQYEEEEQAEKALNALNGRFYAGRLLMAEYSPVTDFRASFPPPECIFFLQLSYSSKLPHFSTFSRNSCLPVVGSDQQMSWKFEFGILIKCFPMQASHDAGSMRSPAANTADTATSCISCVHPRMFASKQ